jgi:hypothetical protein
MRRRANKRSGAHAEAATGHTATGMSCKSATSGCAALPMRNPCTVPLQPAPYEYRIRMSSAALPRVLCLGDSIGGPSCGGAATHPLVKDRLEIRNIQFVTPRTQNQTKLLNSFGSLNLARCVGTWLQGACKSSETRPPCPSPGMRWRGIVLGAGAWDLRSLPCCEMNEARMQRIISNVRASVENALRHADVTAQRTQLWTEPSDAALMS